MIFSKLSKIIDKYSLYISNNQKKYALFCCRGNFDMAIKTSLAAKILSKKLYLSPVIFHTHNENSEILKIYKLFGFKKIIKINIKKISSYVFILTVKDFISAIIFLIFNNLDNFVNSYNVRGIKFGELIYDSYLRYKKDFYRQSRFDLSLWKNIYQTLYTFNFINNFTKKNEVKRTIVTQFSYSNPSTILAKMSLFKNIKTSLLSGPNFFNINKSESFLHPYLVTKTILNQTKFSTKNKKIYKIHLKKRHSGKLWYQPDNINAYKNKKKITLLQLKKRLKIRSSATFDKVILYACHAFKDAPHSTGSMIFRDYYEALYETIEYAKKNNNYLWIFKEHPSAHVFGEENYLYDFFKKEKINEFENIKICPKNIKVSSIIEISDNIVTGTSSLGLEAAAFYGKKPILSGNGYYSQLGFTEDCKTKKHYFDCISNFNFKNNLNSKQIQNANKVMFHIECVLNQTNFGKIFINQKYKKGKKYYYINESKYSNIVCNNLLKNDLINDKYYKYLLKKIIA